MRNDFISDRTVLFFSGSIRTCPAAHANMAANAVELSPLAIPLLIFGAGSIAAAPGALKLLGAVSLLLVAGAPFVAGLAMKLARD